MSTISAVETGIYLYGITDAQDGLAVAMPGIEGGAVETIVANGIAAVVTRVSHQKIRPQRANLAVHHKLLHELVQRQAVLPCAFGTVATSEDQLLEVLRTNCDELLRELAVLRGKMEMSLGVYWNTSNIFEFFVANNQELKEARDRLFRPGREPSMEERLELGKLFLEATGDFSITTIGSADGALPSLGLQIDDIEAQPVLTDYAVDPLVTRLAYGLPGVGT